MSTSRSRISRVFTISFPKPLAQQVDQVAREESRNISELFREAWRAYNVYAMERRLEALRPVVPPNTPAVTQGEIEASVDEIRSQNYKHRKSRK